MLSDEIGAVVKVIVLPAIVYPIPGINKVLHHTNNDGGYIDPLLAGIYGVWAIVNILLEPSFVPSGISEYGVALLPDAIVRISVLPITGAPSATVPLPINNLWTSTTHPNSPLSKIGKSCSNPDRTLIFDVCLINF